MFSPSSPTCDLFSSLPKAKSTRQHSSRYKISSSSLHQAHRYRSRSLSLSTYKCIHIYTVGVSVYLPTLSSCFPTEEEIIFRAYGPPDACLSFYSDSPGASTPPNCMQQENSNSRSPSPLLPRCASRPRPVLTGQRASFLERSLASRDAPSASPLHTTHAEKIF